MDDFHHKHGRLHCEDVPLDRLAEVVGTPAYVYSVRTVVEHVKRLREKLGEAGSYIETVRGVGYRFADNPDEAGVPD